MSTVEITIDAADEGREDVIRRKIARAMKAQRMSTPTPSLNYTLVKRSIDARHGRVRLFLRYEVSLPEVNGGTASPPLPAPRSPLPTTPRPMPSVAIVGSGPAALFAALALLKQGVHPILVERGEMPRERKRDIALISQRGIVNADSNYCFGAGGAGTFSDGKLYTRNNKGARRAEAVAILAALAAAGAPERIMVDSHPHIGTDKLPQIVSNIVDKIIAAGGECRFHTKCVKLLIAGGERGGVDTTRAAIHQPWQASHRREGGAAELPPSAAAPTAAGILTRDTHTGEEREIMADAVLLAGGHSAADIYTMLSEAAPAALEAKGFAVGVRVEHPRALIDAIQYHLRGGGWAQPGCNLGAAEYRLTCQAADESGAVRGVYSFCMCPGGFVVPSATGPGEIVVNGMSASARNSQWSNSAIVMEIRAEDAAALLSKQMVQYEAGGRPRGIGMDEDALYPRDMAQDALEGGFPAESAGDALAGLAWRTRLEHEAYGHGDGQKAPAQRLTDFLRHKDSASLPPSSYTPGLATSRLDEWLPPPLVERLSAAFKVFDSKMKGFITEEAVLIAGETRTSSPVRIVRSLDTLECPAVHGLYAAGEGAGYAGGIVSSAMDGARVAEKIAQKVVGSG